MSALLLLLLLLCSPYPTFRGAAFSLLGYANRSQWQVSDSDSFATMALYKFIYLLTYLLIALAVVEMHRMTTLLRFFSRRVIRQSFVWTILFVRACCLHSASQNLLCTVFLSAVL